MTKKSLYIENKESLLTSKFCFPQSILTKQLKKEQIIIQQFFVRMQIYTTLAINILFYFESEQVQEFCFPFKYN